MEENIRNMRRRLSPASLLTDDLVLHILSRVPYISLCRFKCVSKSWLALCSDPEIRKKSPQTLSGFFYRSITTWSRHCEFLSQFTNVSGRGQPMVDPSLSFMPSYYKILLIDSSNGLLLCRCATSFPKPEYFYVVCNPATENWIRLPEAEKMARSPIVRLAFDPAASSHFRVFLLVSHRPGLNTDVAGVEVYSSKTGAWTYRQSGWGRDCRVDSASRSVLYNGIMHFATVASSVVTVDMELNRWGEIPAPQETGSSCLIGLSQGHLYLVQLHNSEDRHLSVWALEDYHTQHWILKHSVCTTPLPEWRHVHFSGYREVIAIHPERHLIFFHAGWRGNSDCIVSYDMDSGAVKAICAPGPSCAFTYIPYVPCFSKWLSDEN
ncbi:F-box protein At5g07610-like [Lolium rigidum]|uniref:F-box protein At5g07610-like n=1 Tax=Lolium rigidum TaxID=89674 RepID=UPI001F5C5B86|nr:F-box protein At5g07610-like [Lolium rigidum]